MTFAELKCTAADLDPHQKTLKVALDRGKFTPPGGSAPASIVDVYLDQAKGVLRADLQAALDLNPQEEEHNAILDTIVDAQQLLLRQALAKQQLFLALTSITSNVLNKKYIDGMQAGADYEEMKAGFIGLDSSGGTQNVRIIDAC